MNSLQNGCHSLRALYNVAKVLLIVFCCSPAQPSHSDKAGNPEVLRWMNDLAKLSRDLKGKSLEREVQGAAKEEGGKRLALLVRLACRKPR